MMKWLQDRFSLSETGAKGLIKASITSFFSYIAYALPVIIILMFVNEILNGEFKSTFFYIITIIITGVIMHIILDINYVNLYNQTYKESANLRVDIANILKDLPLSYFSKHDVSDLSQTIMQDAADIEHALSHAIPQTLGFCAYFIISVVFLLINNIKLGLAVLVPLFASIISTYISKRAQIGASTEYYYKLRENSDKFQEAIEMHQEIRSYSLKDQVLGDLKKSVEEGENIHIRTEFKQAIPINLASALVKVSLGTTIITGAILIINNEISIIYFIAYLLVATKIMSAMDNLHQNMAEILYLDSRISRIKELRETSIQTGVETSLNSFNIEFRDVSFSYTDKKRIIDDVSFTVEQGKVTALVGPSGCGKTTILRLMARLYDYDTGSILIDGKDIKKINTESLYEKISIVFQNVTLFNSSVMENIRIGNKDATDEQVKEAAKLAHCEEFILKLSDGYDTLIGENGSKLSGGERQRISIARAFLKDAPIILLDEISSSLDVEHEMKIQESLNKLIMDKTVVIISHRLKSIENADKIIVMNSGKVDAVGTHEEVLETSSIYKNMIQKSKLTEEYIY
ncbi:ABC transporter ATP-binding protein [Clostridium argentinense]|nr:ABC transporter ATP-binding protein [Clostridium argentinense]ARC84827.1 ABC transporter ATP-binding protein [Clostridium argentinense]NFF41143.1 ABC transporter ATP-binding protein [Clostridium argentinense]NFP51581.1 ABC transporter ATP-binding protein [Clostridium argentinense]NFP74054.1 ABC transporter ATP-binding protein [Clostridium argentinense]NFP78041.1 ABC transporter ATP-binding protein [Clostridium argentinense]